VTPHSGRCAPVAVTLSLPLRGGPSPETARERDDGSLRSRLLRSMPRQRRVASARHEGADKSAATPTRCPPSRTPTCGAAAAVGHATDSPSPEVRPPRSLWRADSFRQR